jgi:hypothetical protein
MFVSEGARWAEVYVLSTKHQFGIVVFDEVGRADSALLSAAYPEYLVSHQSGDNTHGEVVVLVHRLIAVSRVACSISNVCIIDILGEAPARLIGINAPASKSWASGDMSRYTKAACTIMNGFNIDLEKNGEKADDFFNWA